MSFNFIKIFIPTWQFKYPVFVCIKVAMHACVKECDVIDTMKGVVFVSITSTKAYEVGESLVCERKSSYEYEMILLSR